MGCTADSVVAGRKAAHLRAEAPTLSLYPGNRGKRARPCWQRRLTHHYPRIADKRMACSYPVPPRLGHQLVHALPSDPVALGYVLKRLTLFAERGHVRQPVMGLVLLVPVMFF